jgi:polyphosphate kinase 2 (PPK2 family)
MRVVQKRLSVITDARASLNKKMRQLERLRDQVKKAELLVEDHDQDLVLVLPGSDAAAVNF